jgi:hypothetical protein
MARRSRNGKDATTYKPFITKVIQDLGLAGYKIKYRFADLGRRGGQAKKTGYGELSIAINNTMEDKWIKHTIAHELRHIWQYQNNRLTQQYESGLGSCQIWSNGGDYAKISNDTINYAFRRDHVAYKRLPWEKDANDYANKMVGEDLVI